MSTEMNSNEAPLLWIVVPCYNEEQVLPLTAPLFLEELQLLAAAGKVSDSSSVVFVDDGSSDGTWRVINDLVASNSHFKGIALSRNRGHQNALLCGLMQARGQCDITVSIDCDGQDDITAIERMVDAYAEGYDVVYGVRSKRETDTVFKRSTAEGFYKLLSKMGAEVVFNHADYRLMSARALDGLAEFGEVNLYLRGMVPMVGFPSTTVEYERTERVAGESHYPLGKMLGLAFNGITSLSVKPIRLVAGAGMLFSLVGLVGVLWALVAVLTGNAVTGWASTMCVVCLIGGLQLLSLGVIGEYIGKIYLETKHRPSYIVKERTGFDR